MSKLSVPEMYRSGIAEIGKLSDESFAQLFAALGSAPEFSDANELSAWMSADVSSIPTEARDSILRALTSMTRAMALAETTAPSFSADVWAALKKHAPELISSIDEATFEKRVTRLLEQTPVDLPATKAESLKREVERSYCDARIMTDLRAGFKKTVSEPSMMVLLHNLRIGYHDDKGDHREFYITLDGKDLGNLKRAIDRAQKKALALKDAMKTVNITVVG